MLCGRHFGNAMLAVVLLSQRSLNPISYCRFRYINVYVLSSQKMFVHCTKVSSLQAAQALQPTP